MTSYYYILKLNSENGTDHVVFAHRQTSLEKLYHYGRIKLLVPVQFNSHPYLGYSLKVEIRCKNALFEFGH